MTDAAVKPNHWKFQFRVVRALVLRDLAGRHGDSRLGLLWFLIQPVLVILGLLVIFTVKSRLAPPNIPLLVFLMTGFPLWYAFSGMWGDITTLSVSNSAMTMFPQITQMDMLLSRIVLSFVTQTSGFVVIAIGFIVMGGAEIPSDPLAVIFCYWGCIGLGVGVGLIIGAIRRILPTIETWTSPVRRLGGFISGVMHTAASLPALLLPYFSWNPMFKCIEMARQSWHPIYQTPIWDPWYVVVCIVGLLAAGMVIERGTRRFSS